MAGLLEALMAFLLDSRTVGMEILRALAILVVGIFIGKFVKLLLKKAAAKLQLERIFKFGAVDISLTLIKWAVYIFFLEFAIEQLRLPYLSTSLTNALSIVPRSIGALIILTAGFALGTFFRTTIVQTGKKDWVPLGHIFYYFFLYLAFILVIQLIFTSNAFLSTWVSLLFTGFFLLFLTLHYYKSQ